MPENNTCSRLKGIEKLAASLNRQPAENTHLQEKCSLKTRRCWHIIHGVLSDEQQQETGQEDTFGDCLNAEWVKLSAKYYHLKSR